MGFNLDKLRSIEDRAELLDASYRRARERVREARDDLSRRERTFGIRQSERPRRGQQHPRSLSTEELRAVDKDDDKTIDLLGLASHIELAEYIALRDEIKRLEASEEKAKAAWVPAIRLKTRLHDFLQSKGVNLQSGKPFRGEIPNRDPTNEQRAAFGNAVKDAGMLRNTSPGSAKKAGYF